MKNKKTNVTSAAIKKLSGPELHSVLSRVVKEELARALHKEEANPLLDRVSDQKAFIAWIMRQYFNPTKHGDALWFTKKVNEKNVLDYISQTKNHFPLTPKELSGLWRTIQSSKGGVEKIAKELDQAAKTDPEEETEKGKYSTGEATLKDIGAEVGGLTPTMINKITTAGMEKVRSITGGVNPEDHSPEEASRMVTKIYQARVDVVDEFARLLKGHKGSVMPFFSELVKKNLMTTGDLKMIGETEVEGLMMLAKKSVEQIRNVLLADIERDDNIFKSFQTAVSRKVFPPPKKGRPPKAPKAD